MVTFTRDATDVIYASVEVWNMYALGLLFVDEE